MAGGIYIREKRGIALISEAFQRLQFSKFIETVDISRFLKLFVHIAELQTLFKIENITLKVLNQLGNAAKMKLMNLMK